ISSEVAALAPPAGDRPGDPGDHLLHRALALRRAELAAEVLLGDDVGRVLRPALRELDLALLERGVLRAADHGVADLPLDLVERVDAGPREAALHRQPRLASLYVLCSGFSHQVLPSSGFGGELRILAPGPDGTGGKRSGSGCLRIRRGWQRSGELQIRPPVELAELREAELADAFRGELAAPV